MKSLSERLTRYVVESGAVSEESYAVYQYGFQIGIEMLMCFLTCLGISIYLHMIPEFLISTGSFIFLRTYAGGAHLNSFAACFVCSVAVQTTILLLNAASEIPMWIAWILITVTAGFVLNLAPIECINRKLDQKERSHCKRMTLGVIAVVFILAVIFTLLQKKKFVSLLAWTIMAVLISQYVGLVTYKLKKKI